MPSKVKEGVAVTVLAVLLTVGLTWPLTPWFGSAGRIDSGDGRFSIWNVAWVAHALTTDPGHLFDANIFWPHENALAYSEANLVAGALAVPVWLWNENPYAASNWTIFCSFVAAALAMYGLVRYLTGSIAASGYAAIKYAFSAYAFAHIPQIQLLMTFGPALALWRMHKFIEKPTFRRAVGLGLVLGLQALACGYYGVFGGMAVGLGIVWFGVTKGVWRRWQYWGLALMAAALALIVVAPAFVPYREMRAAGFARSLEDARIFSVQWRSYLASPMLMYRWVLPLLGSWREVLFPGFVPTLLATTCLVLTFRAKGKDHLPVGQSVVAYYFVLAALAVWASTGPQGGLYTVFYNLIPFFTMLRAPSRFGLIVTLAIVVLAGIGFAIIERRLTRRLRLVFTTSVMAFAVVSSMVGPLDFVQVEPTPAVYKRLANLPRAPVVEFPYFTGAADRHRHTEYMLMSTLHWQPLINGYSDYIPPDAFNAMPILAEFPTPQGWRLLRDRQVRYLVMHWNKYPPGESGRVAAEIEKLGEYLMPMVTTPQASLFQILGWPLGL